MLFLLHLSYLQAGVFFITLLLLLGCTKETETDKKDSSAIDQSLVLATIGDRSISTDDFVQYLTIKSNQRGMTKEKLSVYLGEMIREEVLYQHAKTLKLDKNPEIQQKIRQILSQKLLEDVINRKVWEQAIDDQELQNRYKEQVAKYNRPEQIRISVLYAAVTKSATKQQTDKARKKLSDALEQLTKSNRERQLFGNLQRKYSDTHPALTHNNTDFFSAEKLPDLPEQVTKIAFEINRVGKFTNHIIEADDGLYVIMLTGKRAAIHRSLESVRPQLERNIRRATLTRKRTEFIEGLHDKANVEINSAVLSKFAQEQNLRGSKKMIVDIPALPKTKGL